MDSPRTILVIDHDPTSRRGLETVLRAAGMQVGTVGEASEAIAAMRALKPSLLVIAADLPGPTGLELLAEVRGAESGADLPVIITTPGQDDELLDRAFEAGADDVLRKPIRGPELLARIRESFRMRQYVEELARKERDAQVMLELTQALASSLDFREILYMVVRRIAEVVRVSRVSIVLAPEPEEGDVGYVVVASDDEELSNLRLDLTKYPEIQQVLRTRSSLTINDVKTHPLLDGVRDDVQNAQLSAMSLFPIVWQDQAIGVLFLRARAQRGSLSEREVHFCRIVANATAVALRNARVMQSLRDHTQQVTFARFEAERRLRSLKRYADLFASAADGIAVIDVDGRLLFANPRAYEITGFDEQTLRGSKMRDIIHADDRGRARTIWEGFTRGEYPRGEDLRVVRLDGAEIVANFSFAPMLDGDGAVLLSFRDVTEHRRTEAELVRTKEFLESLIDASVDGIVAADLKGKIILFNKGAERIYGYSPSEVVGKMDVRRLYPGDGAREVMKMLRSRHHGGEGRLENMRLEVLARNGEVVPINLSAAIIYEGGQPVATFGIFTDLREKLRVEERLAQAQEKLAVTEKQALIAELAGAAAHELNQPLTSVMGYAELLKRKLDRSTPEHHAADIIVREAERMADIVRKIGKITKYETKSYVGQQKILDLDKSSGGDDPTRVTGE